MIRGSELHVQVREWIRKSGTMGYAVPGLLARFSAQRERTA